MALHYGWISKSLCQGTGSTYCRVPPYKILKHSKYSMVRVLESSLEVVWAQRWSRGPLKGTITDALMGMGISWSFDCQAGLRHAVLFFNLSFHSVDWIYKSLCVLSTRELVTMEITIHYFWMIPETSGGVCNTHPTL